MKKLVRLFSVAMLVMLFTGCMTSTGQYLYDKVEDNKVMIYKVVKKGVVTLMTQEQIQEYKLDKVSDSIEYLYTVNNEGKIVE